MVLSAVNAYSDAVLGCSASDVLAADKSNMDMLFNQYNGKDFEDGAQLKAFIVEELTKSTPLHPVVLSACTQSPILLLTFTTETNNDYTFTAKRYQSSMRPQTTNMGEHKHGEEAAVVLLHAICATHHRYQRLHQPGVAPESVLVMETVPCATRLELISQLSLVHAASRKNTKVRQTVL